MQHFGNSNIFLTIFPFIFASINLFIPMATTSKQILPKLINKFALHEAILNNKSQIRILDCTYLPQTRNPKTFNTKFYGRFEEQVIEGEPNFEESYSAFLAQNIPNSIHFNLGLATHPTPHDKFALYPPKIFQHYVQLLGINSDDNLVFYGRGKLGGMLFAARAYWLFKAYSQSRGGLSILNGGLDAWNEAKLPIQSGNQSEPPFAKIKGNWMAKDPSDNFIQFKELVSADAKNLSGNQIILDARPRGQFQGCEFGFDPNATRPSGSHLPGAINIPSTELVDPETGLMISPQDLRGLLQCNGLDVDKIGCNSKPLVTLCNAGNQASLLAAAMDVQLNLTNLRVFGGSMFEFQTRAPWLISESGNIEKCTKL